MRNNVSGKTDLPILIISIIAVLVAGALSMATIARWSDKNVISTASIPVEAADEAARAGIGAARWHIECHGRTTAGSLSPHYNVNGGLYRVAWGDMNLQDSLVEVISEGIFTVANNQDYSVRLDSTIKVNFLPAHTNEILTSYYSEKRADFIDSPGQ
jgi:hypothetical protein